MECPASGARPEHPLLRARVADINSNLDNLGAGGVIVDHARRYSRRAAEIFPRPLFSPARPPLLPTQTPPRLGGWGPRGRDPERRLVRPARRLWAACMLCPPILPPE